MPSLRVLLCLLLLWGGSLFAATKPLPFSIQGINGKVLDNVQLRLRELTELKPLTEFTPDELSFQINNALKPFGYFKAQISIAPDVISITPGPQLIITSIHARIIGEGKNNPELREILHNLPIKVGEPLLTENYNKAKLSLLNKAESLGYLHADFKKAQISVDENHNNAQIELIFNTNSLYYFGQVQFDPTNINPNLLHRFVPFKAGQIYSSEAVLKLNKALSDSGYFNSVLVKPDITNSNIVPIHVNTQPQSRYTYFLGAGFGTDTGPRGRAGLNIIPVNTWGHQFSVQGLGSMTQNTLQARYSIPGRNPVVDQYNITGNFSSLDYDTGYSNASQLSLAQRHQLERFQRTLSINGLYEGFHYTEQNNVSQFLLYPKATFTFKYTPNKLFSPSGYILSFNALGASQSVLSQIDMGQFWVDAKAAFTIEPWHLRLYGHGIQGYTSIQNINQLPLSLALLLGGTDTLKAYSFNSIGPGRIISYGGLEAQKETFKDWYLLGFYEAGTVYNPQPYQLQHDAGGGLMWVSPIGPIKVGLAKAINHGDDQSGALRLFFSMGPDL